MPKHTAAVSGHETDMCVIKTPELGGFQSGEQMNHKTCLKIYLFLKKEKHNSHT